MSIRAGRASSSGRWPLGAPGRGVAAAVVLVAGIVYAGGVLRAARPEPPTVAAVVTGTGVTGRVFTYRARPGDSLSRVGARFGVDFRQIAKLNGLPWDARLDIGQRLRIDDRHVVPGGVADGLLLNIPQRMLFLFRDRRLVRAYPVAVGRSMEPWQTPVRTFRISAKDVNPTWIVPAGIQEEMRAEGKDVETEVPPGPDNPLGEYRLRLAGSDWAIHGTNAPQSIYSFQTHGCVRLGPDDIRDLFSRVAVGDAVFFVYEPVLMAVGPDGTVFLEADPDVYNEELDFPAMAARAAAALGVASRLDPALVQRVLSGRIGIAQRVDRRVPSPERSPARE